MRSARQIKKFSKQAMEILIRDFGYKRDSFTLEPERHGGRWALEWTYWTPPCYWHGESDSFPATYKLLDHLYDFWTDYSAEGKPIWNGPRLQKGIKNQIRQARQLVAMKGGE